MVEPAIVSTARMPMTMIRAIPSCLGSSCRILIFGEENSSHTLSSGGGRLAPPFGVSSIKGWLAGRVTEDHVRNQPPFPAVGRPRVDR